MKNLYANFTSMLKCLPVILGIVFSATQTVQADDNSVAETNAKLAYNMSKYVSKKVLVGGDISLDFVASAPLSYNHQTGGGYYDDRTIGRDKDVVESLEGGDFTCGDLVTYLTKITVSPTAVLNGNNTIELDYSFLAASTGQPGVALGAIRTAQVNTGDPAIIDNGVSANAYLNGGYDITTGDGGTINGTKFIKPATLNGTVTITGLDRGDVIIVRVDVRIDCQFPSSPTGNLQAALPAARVVGLTGKAGNISVGQQTVPFKNVNLIQQATCMLSNITSACINEVKTFTVSGLPLTMTSPTYAWSFTANTPSGNATFVDSNGDPLNPVNTPGSVGTVYVKATSAGSYTVSVTVSQAGFSNAVCSRTVTINAALAEPDDEYIAPLCDETTFSVKVKTPTIGATYSILDKCGNAITGVMVGSTTTSSYTPTTTADFIFSNIPAGSGYQITATKDNCSSPTASCGTCPSARQTAPTSKPAIGKAETKDLIAYPVPFSEKVTVEFKATKAENYVINLYDLQGHLVRQLKAGNAKAGEVIKVEVSGAGMSESMYLVRKVSKSGISTVKLLKKD